LNWEDTEAYKQAHTSNKSIRGQVERPLQKDDRAPFVNRPAVRGNQKMGAGQLWIKNYHKCPVKGCTAINQYQKAHAFHHHLPDVFSECKDPKLVSSARVDALNMMATSLLGRHAKLQELVDHVKKSGLLKREDNKVISQIQERGMLGVCRVLHLEPPAVFTMHPFTSPAVLIHWKALVLIVALLSPRKYDTFMEKYPRSLHFKEKYPGQGN
jgi:hypothetical protein